MHTCLCVYQCKCLAHCTLTNTLPSIHGLFRGGGLVVVGSYVPKSSEQLQHLREMGGIEVCVRRQGVERELHTCMMRGREMENTHCRPPKPKPMHTSVCPPISHTTTHHQQKQAVELQVDRVIQSKQAQDAEAARVRGEVEALLKAGRDVAVYTTRALRQVRHALVLSQMGNEGGRVVCALMPACVRVWGGGGAVEGGVHDAGAATGVCVS